MTRVPDWIEGRLGNYYLYFADHKGRYIDSHTPIARADARPYPRSFRGNKAPEEQLPTFIFGLVLVAR